MFRSSNGGRTWDLSFDAGGAAKFNKVFAPNASSGFIGGALGGKSAIWAYDPKSASNRPVLSVGDVVLMGGTDPGGAHR